MYIYREREILYIHLYLLVSYLFRLDGAETPAETHEQLPISTIISIIIIVIIIVIIIITIIIIIIIIIICFMFSSSSSSSRRIIILPLVLRPRPACHILPPSEIGWGLFSYVSTGSEGKHLFHGIG